jgi:hypothetical protein
MMGAALIKPSANPLEQLRPMRFALVDAKFPNATVNTVATYTPYASTAYGLTSLAFNNGVGYFGATATAEGYATDATNGGLLWDHAFQAWSDQLATRLQELGACRG